MVLSCRNVTNSRCVSFRCLSEVKKNKSLINAAPAPTEIAIIYVAISVTMYTVYHFTVLRNFS